MQQPIVYGWMLPFLEMFVEHFRRYLPCKGTEHGLSINASHNAAFSGDKLVVSLHNGAAHFHAAECATWGIFEGVERMQRRMKPLFTKHRFTTVLQPNTISRYRPPVT